MKNVNVRNRNPAFESVIPENIVLELRVKRLQVHWEALLDHCVQLPRVTTHIVSFEIHSLI